VTLLVLAGCSSGSSVGKKVDDNKSATSTTTVTSEKNSAENIEQDGKSVLTGVEEIDQ
jgi:hypothetical protein